MSGGRKWLAAALVLLLTSTAAVGQAETSGATSSPATASELRLQAYGLFVGTVSDKANAVALLRQAAEQGDAEAMAFLGSIHLSGDGVEPDRAAAIAWYLKAAQAGHAGSAAKLAELASTPAPPPTAAPAEVRLPEAAPDTNNQRVDALARLAEPATAEGAFADLETLAKAGDAEAMLAVGMAHLKGEGTPSSRRQAAVWFEKAADAGSLGGKAMLAEILITGTIGVPKDSERAQLLLVNVREGLAALDRTTDAARILEYARQLAGSGAQPIRNIAAALLEELAEAGSVEATLERGKMAQLGYERESWLARAAEMGSEEAITLLDSLHDKESASTSRPITQPVGSPTSKRPMDATSANESRHEAALAEARAITRQGNLTPDQLRTIASLLGEGSDAKHPASMLMLAETYFELDHIVAVRAVRLLKEYIELTGDASAMARLARAMEFAEGTPLDLAGALSWLQRAKTAGLENVEISISRVQSKLQLAPWPETERPPEDRWGQFKRDGFPAVGIGSGAGSASFICFQQELTFEFVPDGPIAAEMEAVGNVAVVYSENGRWALSMKRPTFNRLIFAGDPAIDWLTAIADASVFDVGLAADVSNDSEPELFNVSQFTGRGSSAARNDIVAICQN